MFNILVTILTSYNEYILYETYLSIYNQINHKLNYTIVIIVNTLNPHYYHNVSKKFKDINIKIIQTKSNGKPGMGHNSVINYFKNNPEYDYLIPIDGDDFLYPQALQQLSKIFSHNPTVIVGGNEDYISNFKDLYNNDNCYNLENSYFLKTEPNIHSTIHFNLYGNGTPVRLILLHKTIFNYIKNDKYYCEKSKVFDDYLFYLNILDLYYSTNINIYYISLKNIYLYYKAHISSVCYQNSHNCDDDIEKMVENFTLLKNLEKTNIIFKLPILYISNYLSNTISYKNINNTISYEIQDFIKTPEFIDNYTFSKHLCENLYKATMLFIQNNLEKKNFNENEKMYLLLENFILNEHITYEIFDYFLQITNNLSYIAEDIITILINYVNNNNINLGDYKKEFDKSNYVNVYLSIKNILDQNITYEKSIFYYLNNVSLYLNINNQKITDNSLVLNNSKKTFILLDYMDIDYNPITPYIKGIGGTQLCYIYLGIELSKYYNVIILNKKEEGKIEYINDIYTISYKSNDDMIKFIKNIDPDKIIYNFVGLGEFLKINLKNTIKLIMYEHICIYSNFNSKLSQNYYNFYDKIIFISNNQYNEYKKYVKINETKNIILNNGLSPIFEYNNIENSLLQNKELNIIYLSNPQRGLECFEYIYPLLKNKYPNITLEIYSSLDMYNIEDNTYLKNLYSRLEKIEGIYCNKSISQKELVSKLNKSLLFIYPTFVEETFCNCMIEAMSCGCYVISTNIGALKEIARPYGDFIDIDKTKSPEHPYYESIDNEYINKIVEKTSKVIDKYNMNDIKLENLLEEQIKFIKKKYNWKNQSKYLYEKLN